jgi:hypothetical protein
MTGQSDINIDIRSRKLGWLAHTRRKGCGEIPSVALTWNRQGNRKRGRPEDLVVQDHGGRIRKILEL